MTTESQLASFLNDVKEPQTMWALQDTKSEDWIVLDSINFENTDVMPLWSSEKLAKSHCIDEWANYVPAKITVAHWMEYWVEELLADGVIIGIDWQETGECAELELAEFTQALAAIEVL